MMTLTAMEFTNTGTFGFCLQRVLRHNLVMVFLRYKKNNL
jgi:hypothetical protein